MRALAVSPSTGLIASGDKDNGEIGLWDGTPAGSCVYSPTNARESARSSFSPDGKKLLSTCGDTCSGYIQNVWDAASGRKITSYSGHRTAPENTVFAAGLSADGKWAVTADSSKSEVHVWDAQTGKQREPIGVLRGSGMPVWAVGFSHASDRIGWGHTLTGNTDNGKGPLESQLHFPADNRGLELPETLSAADANAMVRARETFSGWSLGFGKSAGEDDPTGAGAQARW